MGYYGASSAVLTGVSVQHWGIRYLNCPPFPVQWFLLVLVPDWLEAMQGRDEFISALRTGRQRLESGILCEDDPKSWRTLNYGKNDGAIP